jgi:hypothetical protein
MSIPLAKCMDDTRWWREWRPVARITGIFAARRPLAGKRFAPWWLNGSPSSISRPGLARSRQNAAQAQGKALGFRFALGPKIGDHPPVGGQRLQRGFYEITGWRGPVRLRAEG